MGGGLHVYVHLCMCVCRSLHVAIGTTFKSVGG